MGEEFFWYLNSFYSLFLICANEIGRETFLVPVEWEDDWPVVKGKITLSMESPGLYEYTPPVEWRDDFQSLSWAGTGRTLR